MQEIIYQTYPAQIAGCTETLHPFHAPTDASMSLSVRELEVLQLVSEGYSNIEIATYLYISRSTVKTHLRNIFRKLNVEGRVQAAITALQRGMVSPVIEERSHF